MYDSTMSYNIICIVVQYEVGRLTNLLRINTPYLQHTLPHEPTNLEGHYSQTFKIDRRRVYSVMERGARRSPWPRTLACPY